MELYAEEDDRVKWLSGEHADVREVEKRKLWNTPRETVQLGGMKWSEDVMMANIYEWRELDVKLARNIYRHVDKKIKNYDK